MVVWCSGCGHHHHQLPLTCLASRGKGSGPMDPSSGACILGFGMNWARMGQAKEVRITWAAALPPLVSCADSEVCAAVFWMAYRDFVTYFNRLDVCKVRPLDPAARGSCVTVRSCLLGLLCSHVLGRASDWCACAAPGSASSDATHGLDRHGGAAGSRGACRLYRRNQRRTWLGRRPGTVACAVCRVRRSVCTPPPLVGGDLHGACP